MNHLKLALILILLSVQPVRAESFTFMGEVIGASVTGATEQPEKWYFDSGNIKRNGNFRMTTLIIHRPLKGSYGELSHVSKWEYDCYEEKRRRISWAAYSEPFGKGEMIRYGNDEGEGTPMGRWFRIGKGPNDPDPRTIIVTKILNIICAK